MSDIPYDSWWHRREELEQHARTFDKAVKLKLKTGGIWNISKALKTYATTIGRTVYIPVDWTHDYVMRILPHEVLGHVKQFRWSSFGIHPVLGIFPVMFVLYCLLPLPIWLAWCRYRLELHAESISWKYHLEQSNSTAMRAWVKLRSETFPKKVSGKEYFFSVPRCWALWGFKRRAEKVLKNASH